MPSPPNQAELDSKWIADDEDESAALDDLNPRVLDRHDGAEFMRKQAETAPRRRAGSSAITRIGRADLHERFAFWLEEHGTDLVELDESSATTSSRPAATAPSSGCLTTALRRPGRGDT